jgi:hypothetical protein
VKNNQIVGGSQTVFEIIIFNGFKLSNFVQKRRIKKAGTEQVKVLLCDNNVR